MLKAIAAVGLVGLAAVGVPVVGDWQRDARYEAERHTEQQRKATLAACMGAHATIAAKRVIAERYWGAWKERPSAQLGFSNVMPSPPAELDHNAGQALEALRERCEPTRAAVMEHPAFLPGGGDYRPSLSSMDRQVLAYEMGQADAELQRMVDQQSAEAARVRAHAAQLKKAKGSALAAARASEASWAIRE